MISWGFNDHGQIGDGTTVNRLSPVSVGEAIWKKISTGDNYAFGIQDDDSLWGWGDPSSYELGNDNDDDIVTIPTKLGTDTWNDVACGTDHTLGIKQDGTLWAWGRNGYKYSNEKGGYGCCGIGSLSVYAVHIPTQVGIDNDWDIVSAAQYTSAALKQDGTLWTWGYNGDGQCGLGISDESILSLP